jgi:hypothetical protein
MRVVSLAIAGGGIALFAAQAGVIPSVDFGSGPDRATTAALSVPTSSQPPAALAVLMAGAPSAEEAPPPALIVNDTYVRAQALDLPDGSGFAAPPALVEVAMGAWEDGLMPQIRPAAFAPAMAPAYPDTVEAPATTVAEQALSPFGLPCGLEITAEAGPAATIALGIAAPCHPGERVTIAHSGLTFSATTDAVGLLNLDLPALESPAHVTVRLDDASEAAALVSLPDIAAYDRVALAWDGDLGMELHALEAGADWFSDGHVHPATPRDAAVVEEGRGYLVLLGEAATGMAAQVYTLPHGEMSAEFSVDAPITRANCASRAEARVLRMEGGGRVEVTPLGFTYPGCEAVGDTLVLQNALRDLRLAAN